MCWWHWSRYFPLRRLTVVVGSIQRLYLTVMHWNSLRLEWLWHLSHAGNQRFNWLGAVTTDIRQMPSKSFVWAEFSHESKRIKLHNHATKDLEADGEFRDIFRCIVMFLCRGYPDFIKKNDCNTQTIHLIQFYGFPDYGGLCFEWFTAVLRLVYKNQSNHHLDEQQTKRLMAGVLQQ